MGMATGEDLELTVGISFEASGMLLIVPSYASGKLARLRAMYPEGVTRVRALREEAALAQALGSVRSVLDEHGVQADQVVALVPDDFGLREKTRFRRQFRDAGLPVWQLIPRLEAVALGMARQLDFRVQREWRGVLAAEYAETVVLSQFSIDAGLAELEDTIILERKQTQEGVELGLQEQAQAAWFAQMPGTEVIFFGTDETGFLLRRRLEEWTRGTNRAYRPVQVLQGAPDMEVIGLGDRVQLGNLGRGPVLLLSGLSPYHLVVSVQDSMFTAFEGAASPTPSVHSMVWVPKAGTVQATEVRMYEERRAGLFECLGSLLVPYEVFAPEAGAEAEITASADRDGRVSITLSQKSTGAAYTLPYPEDWERVQAEAPGETVPEPESAEAAEIAESPDLETFLRDFLQVADNLDYAVRYAKNKDDAVYEGICRIRKSALDVMARYGLEPIEAEGARFDYHLHDAVAHVDDMNLPAETVREVVQSGYLYHGKLFRAASVIVAN